MHCKHTSKNIWLYHKKEKPFKFGRELWTDYLRNSPWTLFKKQHMNVMTEDYHTGYKWRNLSLRKWKLFLFCNSHLSLHTWPCNGNSRFSMSTKIALKYNLKKKVNSLTEILLIQRVKKNSFNKRCKERCLTLLSICVRVKEYKNISN